MNDDDRPFVKFFRWTLLLSPFWILLVAYLVWAARGFHLPHQQ